MRIYRACLKYTIRIQGRILCTKTTQILRKHGSLDPSFPTYGHARSPDLNPLDSYVLGLLKSIVRATAVNDVQRKVEDGCELFRRPNTRRIFEHVRQSLLRLAARCVDARITL
jgi:hypothetical protein